jgi:hypothetical protein
MVSWESHSAKQILRLGRHLALGQLRERFVVLGNGKN